MQLHHHHHHHRQQQQKQQQQNQLERGGQRIHHEKYNNLTSVFAKVSDETVLAMKQRAMKPIVHLDPAESLQVDMNALYHGSTNNRNAFDLPVRPPWSYSDSKEQLDTREEAYFKKWVEQVYAAASDSTEGDQLQDFSSPSSVSSLSFFEHNLEVWRQLWRVAEVS